MNDKKAKTHERKQENLTPAKPTYSIANSLVSYYLFAMFSFFTLFLTNQYANARHDKFYLYIVLSGILIISTAISSAIRCSEQKRNGTPQKLFTPFTTPDIAFCCFFVFAAISTVFSRYPLDSLTGNEGRNNGLILLLLYTLVYFTLTRLYVYKEYLIAVYLVFSSFVAGLAVINYFYIDPFGLLNGYDEATVIDFGSTIGNKNTTASFMCLFIPVAIMIFVIAQKRYMRVIGGISILFAYTGLLCTNSSSAILGLIVILPILLIFCARSYEYLMRFMLALMILFISGKVLRMFSLIMGEHNKGFEFMQDFLIFSPLTYLPIAICGIIFLLMFFLKKNAEPHYPSKVLTAIFTTLTILLFSGAVFAFIYYSLINTQAVLDKSLERLVRFDDRWGTHRGFMWIKSMEEYMKFDLFSKLFGSGPDTIKLVLEPHFQELLARFGNTDTNAAHNEFINYLVTQGALGLLSYLVILGSVVIRSLRRAKYNPMTFVFSGAVICYAVQSVVNLYQPITTPLFFIFISLAEALNRQVDKEIS